MTSPLLRNLLFTILQLGLVAGLIPYSLPRNSVRALIGDGSFNRTKLN